MSSPAPPPPLARARHGRLVGGVCAGVGARMGVPVAQVRLLVLASTLLFGLGAALYVAAWLIVPAEGEDGSTGPRAIVAIAQAGGALIGLGALGMVGGLATVFGLGSVVLAVVLVVVVGVLAAWPRVGPAWALLPVGALVLPSVVVASSGVRLDPSAGSVRVAPATFADLPRGGVRSGLGTIEVDLRRTAFPRTGRVRLPLDVGLTRALVALPHDRCVRVVVRRHPRAAVLRAATGVVRRGTETHPPVTAFGQSFPFANVDAPRRPSRSGPTLEIDFRSDGGALVVRDYPDDVVPALQPDWPGYQVFPEPRPDTTGLPRREARRLLRGWRTRHAEQVRDRRRVGRLLPGPCARTTKERAR